MGHVLSSFRIAISKGAAIGGRAFFLAQRCSILLDNAGNNRGASKGALRRAGQAKRRFLLATAMPSWVPACAGTSGATNNPRN